MSIIRPLIINKNVLQDYRTSGPSISRFTACDDALRKDEIATISNVARGFWKGAKEQRGLLANLEKRKERAHLYAQVREFESRSSIRRFFRSSHLTQLNARITALETASPFLKKINQSELPEHVDKQIAALSNTSFLEKVGEAYIAIQEFIQAKPFELTDAELVKGRKTIDDAYQSAAKEYAKLPSEEQRRVKSTLDALENSMKTWYDVRKPRTTAHTKESLLAKTRTDIDNDIRRGYSITYIDGEHQIDIRSGENLEGALRERAIPEQQRYNVLSLCHQALFGILPFAVQNIARKEGRTEDYTAQDVRGALPTLTVHVQEEGTVTLRGETTFNAMKLTSKSLETDYQGIASIMVKFKREDELPRLEEMSITRLD